MQIAVTGSTGRVGRVVVAHLVSWGHQVRGIDQRVPENRGVRGQFWHADLGDLGQTYGALAGVDAVVHLAAIPAPDSNPNEVVFGNNVMATYHVLEAAAGLGIRRVVIASSISALGTAYMGLYPEGRKVPIHYFPLDEEHPMRSIDSYGLSKMVDEMACDSFSGRTGMVTVALRYSWVTYPSDYPGVAQRANKREYSSSLWSYTDVRDVAQSVGRSLTAPLDGFNPFYITATDSISNIPTRDLLHEHYPDVTKIDPALTGTMSAFSNARAEKLIGYKPRYSWRQYTGSKPDRNPNENPEEDQGER